MGAQTEAVLKLLLCIAAVAALALRHLRPGTLAPGRAGPRLAAAAAVAALAYTNFGLFHGWPPLHTRELFHYFLGSKYLPELKHDGLYVASMAAQFERHPEVPAQPFMRNLRTNRIVPLAELEGSYRQVRERFDGGRWREFVDDHDFFVTPGHPERLDLYRLDHGFNASPTWSFVARLFSRWMRAGTGSFLFLASLDLLLMAGTCFAIGRTYGGRVAAMVVLLLGLGAPWRFDWIGGAFLRADWFAALGLGICALKRERFAWAGALIGYAAMIRVFPAAFLVGPTLVALRQWTQGSPPRWWLRLAAGALAAVALGVVAGGFSGAGFATWPDFLERMVVYRESLPANGISLTNALLVDRAAHTDAGGSLLDGEQRREAQIARAERERRAPNVVATALLVLLTLAAMWGRPPDEAALLGGALLFAGLSLASYYWIVLALVPLAGARWLPTASVLAFSAFVFAVILLSNEQLQVTYGAASWALLVLLLAWLTPWARETARSLGGGKDSRGGDAAPPTARKPRRPRPRR